MVFLKSCDEAEASSSTTSPFTYDVFLSFRGADTRKNFTDHLYTALLQAGLRTFRDDDEIERGESLKPELEKAIKQSEVSVIVFSENYATSKWCLDEVLAILEHRRSSKHKVIPVFYDVQPSDVRGQKRSFAQAFHKHVDEADTEADIERKKERMAKVNAWRAALKEATDLTGMVLSDGHESKFIRKLVDEIVRKLDRKALFVEDHLVGIDNSVRLINSWIRIKSDAAKTLVIYGIGGIGKTTIAKHVYNSNYYDFEGSCFLDDIREKSKSLDGLRMLQSQLLSALSKKQKGEFFCSPHEGTMKIRKAIGNRMVLIVLDDVTDVNQVEALLGPQGFCQGSKVIITTRHQGLANGLENSRSRVQSIEITELDYNDSMNLFSWYAFGQDHPLEAFLEQSKAIVDHCGGHPLALKVVGSSLKKKGIDIWKATWSKLKDIPDADIQKTLQISYESLKDDVDKRLFLHIACFFVGSDKDYVVKILDQCGLYPVVGIQNLIDRCLLVVQFNTLMMHQLIQEMGREVVRQESPENPGKRSRLWQDKDSFDVLKEKTGTKQIEGLVLDVNMLKKDVSSGSSSMVDNTNKSWYQKLPEILYMAHWITSSKSNDEDDLKTDAFEKMENLMLLNLNDVQLSGSYEKLPKRLRWLCWFSFPLKSIPVGFHLEKLVVLEMRFSKLVQVWKGYKLLPSLKILDLSYSEELVRTPDSRGLPSLESLILKGCSNLREVCEHIVYLEGLVLLELDDCKSLTNIPCLPSSLQRLGLSKCLNMGNVGSPRPVDWSACLPRYLVSLDIGRCNLTDHSFPLDLSHLFSLLRLNISHNSITAFPDCFKRLPSLKELTVHNCLQLKTLLGVPRTVEALLLEANESLEEVMVEENATIAYFHYPLCPKLAALEGCFKLVATENADQEILYHMGLEYAHEVNESNVDAEQFLSMADGPIKILYEFGIFSTCILRGELPRCFTFREKGSDISFGVPLLPDNQKIEAFSICFTASFCDPYEELGCRFVKVEIYNGTKDLSWTYYPSALTSLGIDQERPDFVWLSVWKCGEFLEAGDEVDVHIFHETMDGYQPKECCVDIIYNDEIRKEDEGEGDTQHVRTSPRLSWNDKVLAEISSYNICKNDYVFATNGYALHFEAAESKATLVDWWGPKRNEGADDFARLFPILSTFFEQATLVEMLAPNWDETREFFGRFSFKMDMFASTIKYL